MTVSRSCFACRSMYRKIAQSPLGSAPPSARFLGPPGARAPPPNDTSVVSAVSAGFTVARDQRTHAHAGHAISASVCLCHSPAALRCCGFAAVGPAARRYRSIAARPALNSSGVRMRAGPRCQRARRKLNANFFSSTFVNAIYFAGKDLQ